MADLEMTEFSEDAAVEFVLQHLPEEFKDGMNRSTVLDIIIYLYDYFENNGLLDLSNMESEADEEKMIDYIMKRTRRQFSPEALLAVIRLEDEYENSINDF